MRDDWHFRWRKLNIQNYEEARRCFLHWKEVQNGPNHRGHLEREGKEQVEIIKAQKGKVTCQRSHSKQS